MNDEIKALLRKEFAKELLDSDMSQDQLGDYLASDMKQSPTEWVNAHRNSEINNYLEDKFPDEKKRREHHPYIHQETA